MKILQTSHEKNICGKQVKKLRNKLGMAQVDLAEALNVDYGFKFEQSDISEIERKARGIRDYELKAISIILNVSPGDLLDPDFEP